MAFKGTIEELIKTCNDIANELGVSGATVVSAFRYSNNEDEVKEMIRADNAREDKKNDRKKKTLDNR